jgi:hypothetical protein
MKARLLPVLTVLMTFALTAPAWAHDNGEGIVGPTDDKIITFFSLGLVVFFTMVTVVGSWAQGRLEKRKEARKAEALRSRIGW